MTVWVVYEEDRGMGVTIVGVYADRARAEQVRAEHGHYYIQQAVLD